MFITVTGNKSNRNGIAGTTRATQPRRRPLSKYITVVGLGNVTNGTGQWKEASTKHYLQAPTMGHEGVFHQLALVFALLSCQIYALEDESMKC